MDKYRAGGQDAGADILVALNACWPNVLTADELDAEIDNVFFEQVPEYKREWCGIEKATWHQDCILKALEKKYGDRVKWIKVPIDSIYEKHHGKLYVHGMLEPHLFDMVPYFAHRKISEEFFHHWTYSVCIDTDNNKIVDFKKGLSWFDFLRATSRPLTISNFFHKCGSENMFREIWDVRKLEITDGVDEISDLETDDETFGFSSERTKLAIERQFKIVSSKYIADTLCRARKILCKKRIRSDESGLDSKHNDDVQEEKTLPITKKKSKKKSKFQKSFELFESHHYVHTGPVFVPQKIIEDCCHGLHPELWPHFESTSSALQKVYEFGKKQPNIWHQKNCILIPSLLRDIGSGLIIWPDKPTSPPNNSLIVCRDNKHSFFMVWNES
jgi:hypothetical protein